MCIWIINYQAGEIVYQPIIQLFGFDSFYHETILANNKYQWPIVQGLFKIYIPLESGENTIQLSTSASHLSFTIIYCPPKTTNINLRLVCISFSNEVDRAVEQTCKQFLFLTKLVRCTLDEILHKQTGCNRSLIFDIEKQIHHLSMSKENFEAKGTDQEIFKEIYRQIYATDLAQDTSVKLMIHSSISPSITFASTFNNVIVLNLPKQFSQLPTTFDEFHQNLQSIKNESLFYSVGAYLHELGHLFGLDHGNSGKDFFLITPRLCSIIFHQQCSCYKEPVLHVACSYSNGVFNKQSIHLKSTCQSDVHCRFSVKFAHQKKPNQCDCSGQFQFEIEHCCRLVEQFDQKSNQ